MSTVSNNLTGSQIDHTEIPASASRANRLILFLILLFCSVLIFLFGANYSNLFPTNGNSLYTGMISAVFLIAAFLFKRSKTYSKYWMVTYAFFIASAVNFISSLFSGYNTDFLHIFGIPGNTNAGIGLGKVYETLLAVIPIIVLTKLSGSDLGSLFIKKGNLNYKWGLQAQLSLAPPGLPCSIS
jgi:hypothetical protein